MHYFYTYCISLLFYFTDVEMEMAKYGSGYGNGTLVLEVSLKYRRTWVPSFLSSCRPQHITFETSFAFSFFADIRQILGLFNFFEMK